MTKIMADPLYLYIHIKNKLKRLRCGRFAYINFFFLILIQAFCLLACNIYQLSAAVRDKQFRSLAQYVENCFLA